MSRAKILANWYAKDGDGIVLACRYTDGVVVYLVTSEKTQRRVELAFGNMVRESARSDDGFCGVVIAECENSTSCLDRVNLVTGELKWSDNRGMDANTIDDFVAIVQECQ